MRCDRNAAIIMGQTFGDEPMESLHAPELADHEARRYGDAHVRAAVDDRVALGPRLPTREQVVANGGVQTLCAIETCDREQLLRLVEPAQ